MNPGGGNFTVLLNLLLGAQSPYRDEAAQAAGVHALSQRKRSASQSAVL